MLLYLDDFAKFRTRQQSTCACYFSLYNWNSNFISKLESIRLVGFSCTKLSFWEFADLLMEELNRLNGKIIEIPNNRSGNVMKFKVVPSGFIWDTVERVFSLQLMKSECSRCLNMYENEHLTQVTKSK